MLSIRPSPFVLFYCFIDFSFLTPPFFSPSYWKWNVTILYENFALVVPFLWIIFLLVQWSSQYLSLDYCSRILIGMAFTNFYSLQPSLLLTVRDVSITQNWQFHFCIKIICVGHTRYWKNASFLFCLKHSFIICLQWTYTHLPFFVLHVTVLSLLNFILEHWAPWCLRALGNSYLFIRNVLFVSILCPLIFVKNSLN